ncbi:Hypothetical predicted protein [Octopus vulgaris]|uniref:Uncharacterized protein n=1 Tax=Octopus vulgaris TaxID=6645 RepID=A0AA36B9X6_OCTVU|nr:Hypothetical predicted protein [Octopus vulgaris]
MAVLRTRNVNERGSEVTRYRCGGKFPFGVSFEYPFKNNRLTDSEISAIKHATENDINIRHKGNEESDEQYSPPRGLIERLPSDQSTQRPEDTRNSIVPVKDSQENEKTTVTEDLAFAEEHRESMAEMRQKILNTLEVVIKIKTDLLP